MEDKNMILQSKQFDGKTFNKLILVKETLSDKDFTNCVFNKCNFNETNFSFASFTDCRFVNCNLSNCKLNDCKLQRVSFEESKISGFNFSLCKKILISMDFFKCIISYCSFADLNIKGTKFKECSFVETDFQNADLTNSSFESSSFKGTFFSGVNLSGANFLGAYGYSIDLRNNKVKKARFSSSEAISLLDSFDIVLDK